MTYERFDWHYRDEELIEWVSRIRHLQEQVRQVYALFNTNRDALGPANARRLLEAMGQG